MIGAAHLSSTAMANPDEPNERIAILGAGISGLSLGWLLSRQGKQVTLFEASNWTGGLARTFQWRGVPCDLAPHRLHASDSTVLAEIESLVPLRQFKRHSRILMRGKRMRDRSGQTGDFVLERGDARYIEPVFAQTLADDALPCTDASAALAAAARARQLDHHTVNTAQGERRRGPWHIQKVNAYHSRWKNWMVRFQGVATSYLHRYLGWFCALDRNAQSGAPTVSLLALAIGT